MRPVFIAGIGMTRFAKQPDRTLRDLASEAVGCALLDSGLHVSQIESSFVGNAVGGSITGQEMLVGQFCLESAGIGEIPIVNVENACASASTAMNLAWHAVSSGQVDAALALGVEKMTHSDKSRSFSAIGGAVDVATIPVHLPPGRSFLMDLYAAVTAEYMKRTGATREDFARVVVKNQRNGSLNSFAQYGAHLSTESILNDREVVWPFTVPMCSPVTDGAAAVVLISDRHLSRRNPKIAVRASVNRTASVSGKTSVTAATARAAYDMAGIGPLDLDCIEVHDATASAELWIYEQLGLAGADDGPRLIRTGETDIGGGHPVNSSGGLLSRGHPIGATGLAQIVELVLQLRGSAGERQIPDARIGLSQNAGGWHDEDNVVCLVHILEGLGA